MGAKRLNLFPFLFCSIHCNTFQYQRLKKTICIWIIDGSVYDEFKEFESTWKMKEDKLGITGHFEEIEIRVIELQKFRKLDIIKPSKKDFWLWFIDHINKEMIEMACLDNERIKEAKEQYEKITSDKDLMYMITMQQIAEWDEATLINKAKEEGEKQKQLEIAKKMKELGAELEFIAKATNLTIEEIEKL